MRSLMLFVAFIMCSAFSYAQSIKISILDINEKPISDVKVLDKDEAIIGSSDQNGLFIIHKSEHNIIGLSKKGFANRWFKLASYDGKEITVTLQYYYQELDMVEVAESKPESALDIDAVNIIDYVPFNNSILTLKSHRGINYIGIDSLGQEGPKFVFEPKRPKRLFQDCLGNIHVICPEMVYQIAIAENELVIIDQIKKDFFNILLEPCVAKLGGKYVLKALTQNNQAYSLSLYDKYTDPNTFYYEVDEISAGIAAEEVIKVEFSIREQFYEDSLSFHALDLRNYLRQLHNGENPDVSLDFIQKSITKPDGSKTRWTERYAQYKNLTYPINVRSFQVGNEVAVVNYEIDSLILFNEKGEQISQVPFKVNSDIKDVWQDLSNDNLYLYTRNNGNHSIFHLNDVNGKTTFLKSMKEIGFSRKHKIYGGYLYFLEIDNGFYRIQRSRLPNH